MANDAVGYIIPDNDFGPFYQKDHYEELLSFGKHEASALVSVFQALAKKSRSHPILQWGKNQQGPR